MVFVSNNTARPTRLPDTVERRRRVENAGKASKFEKYPFSSIPTSTITARAKTAQNIQGKPVSWLVHNLSM
jgi:hypothetical protein